MNIDHFETCIRTVPAGGVTSPKGFKAAGIHAGFRKNPQRLDMALSLIHISEPTRRS